MLTLTGRSRFRSPSMRKRNPYQPPVKSYARRDVKAKTVNNMFIRPSTGVLNPDALRLVKIPTMKRDTTTRKKRGVQRWRSSTQMK